MPFLGVGGGGGLSRPGEHSLFHGQSFDVEFMSHA